MDDFVFVACRRSVKLVRYNGNAAKVVVPALCEGKPVTEIGPGAFASNYEIKALALPPTVELVDVNAFGWARNLAYIGGTEIPKEGKIQETSVLPASVRSIGPYAFNWNFAMKKLVILGDEIKIDDYAFASSNIEEIFLPNCTELSLGTGAFAHCTKLKRFVAPEADAGMIPSCCFEGCLELYQMDARFAAVGYSAFHSCRSLKDIHLPKTLVCSELDAFKGCALLTGKRKYIK